MSKWTRIALSLAVGLTLAPGAGADEKKPAGGTVPKGVPLELTIVGKTAEYDLDRGGKTAAEYAARIAGAKKLGGRMPAPPAVDLTLVLKNTGDKTIMVYKTGDTVMFELELKGKGVVAAAPNLAFTQEFRLPQAVGLEPGKTIEFPLKSLTGGFRGASHYSYWTEAGAHELVAAFKTGVSPAPEGSKADDEGYGAVTVTSAPFKIAVTEKK